MTTAHRKRCDLRNSPSGVRIVSRASAPDELGLSRDPRPLGVALRSITLLAGPRRHLVEASDTCLRDGFHSYEPDEGIRWTNGNSGLPPTYSARAAAHWTLR
jgi:hypothetical protein